MPGVWTRRAVLSACAAPAMLSAFPAFSSTLAARRTFRILRDGDDIGNHVLTARREGARMTVEIDIAIAVTFLGVTAYRYELTNREVWEDGRILTIDSVVNDDGEPGFCRVRRDGDGLRVDGSGYSGPAPADAATTSYWSADFLSRGVWISTQSGEPLSVSAADQGVEVIESGSGPLTCRRWAISGDMELELWYDASGDWAANAFDAGGEPGRYRLQSGGDSLNTLWTDSVSG